MNRRRNKSSFYSLNKNKIERHKVLNVINKVQERANKELNERASFLGGKCTLSPSSSSEIITNYNNHNRNAQSIMCFREGFQIPPVVLIKKPLTPEENDYKFNSPGTSEIVSIQPRNMKNIKRLSLLPFLRGNRYSSNNLKKLASRKNIHPRTIQATRGLLRKSKNDNNSLALQKSLGFERYIYPRLRKSKNKIPSPESSIQRYSTTLANTAGPLIYSFPYKNPKPLLKKNAKFNSDTINDRINDNYCANCSMYEDKNLKFRPKPKVLGKRMHTLSRETKTRIDYFNGLSEGQMNKGATKPHYIKKEERRGRKPKIKKSHKQNRKLRENEVMEQTFINDPSVINATVLTKKNWPRDNFPRIQIPRPVIGSSKDTKNTLKNKGIEKNFGDYFINNENLDKYCPITPPQEGDNNPIVFDICNSKNKTEINCRLCKECPMRQLISKVESVAGSDRMSYPVVAFTCCRKSPRMKEKGTSMSEL